MDVMKAVAQEFGLVADGTWLDRMVFKRPSLNPAFQTEYFMVTLENDVMLLMGNDCSHEISLSDPASFDKIQDLLNDAYFWRGSHKPFDKTFVLEKVMWDYNGNMRYSRV